MIKQQYTENDWLAEEPNAREEYTLKRKESKLKRQYAAYIEIFSWLFFELYNSKLELVQYRKSRNRDTQSKIPIKKYYNIHILIAIGLLKTLLPYRRKTNHSRALSDTEIIVIRWVSIGYNMFISRDKFLKLCKNDPDIQKIPNDYIKVLKGKMSDAGKNNLNKYIWSMRKTLFIETITYLCKRIDQEKMQWNIAEFLQVSIKNLLMDINITKEESIKVSTGIQIKKVGERTMLSNSLFDKIYLWSKGKGLLEKTRKRYRQNFPGKVEEKIFCGK